MLYRWTLFERVLKLPRETSTQIAMDIYFEDNDNYKKFGEDPEQQ